MRLKSNLPKKRKDNENSTQYEFALHQETSLCFAERPLIWSRKGENEMKKPKLENCYKPKRIFLETLIGYCEASKVKTLDQFGGEKT
jgi:hypothetical protein